ncbi:formamidopyrimidine-DNA glycosylase [Mumia flava]|uniref:Formamidopyrimidine-DNA glycosylase n=1 Tax=Mumia flava TaxID=1348852 RepID=A0A0B2B6V1_9ACTN|nr:bifunctional DNA-formamidopyrimidine glycosylase/DNA-(apurinic or apyrimidinic site) lyase [Mumia flava]PJJ53850.1 formamidopyrimidine-DNA glycosylase [Mumia flava]
MPELPEVEVVRRGLHEHAVGRTIEAVRVLHPRPVRRHLPGPEDFSARLRGQRIIGARRRGKYLWLPLDDGDAILAHLGMSGQFLVQPPEAAYERHLRVVLDLDDGHELRFVDQRMFGGLAISDGGAELPREYAHVAPDPLEHAFDVADFTARVRARRTGIKRALLDQRLVSGVGNIYADEALWRARLHFARPTETLNRPTIAVLLDAVREVMAAALEQGGTSFDALYVSVNGESGYFSRSLEVYGREGEPCSRCGTAIRRDAFMNRSSYTCPRCQPRPRRGRW